MDSIVIKAADLFFTALALQVNNVVDVSADPERLMEPRMSVTCTDVLSGKNYTKVMTADEVEAVVACLLSNSGEGTPAQYKRALVAVEGFPNECRPIP